MCTRWMPPRLNFRGLGGYTLERPLAISIVCTAMPVAKSRLDQLLVMRGFFESREKAQRAIMAGAVRVGEQRIDKPGTRFSEDADITVEKGERYVGRGGLKLEAALAHFALDPSGATCLDIGASTGGFTDCVLPHRAAQ